MKEASRLGPRKADDKEGRILNRIVRWTESGLEHEGDPRHVEKLLLELGLRGSKPVCTPGVKPSVEQHNAEEVIPDNNVAHFKSWAARSNFVSKPTELSVEGFKRLDRYLSGPVFERADTDHAGCLRTRKSTSGVRRSGQQSGRLFCGSKWLANPEQGRDDP